MISVKNFNLRLSSFAIRIIDFFQQKQMGVVVKYDAKEKVYGIYNQKEKTALYFDYK